jgi:hypothetical protein
MLFLASLASASSPQRLPSSIHAQQAAEFGEGVGVLRASWPPPRMSLVGPTPGPDLRVYGYLPYWEDELTTLPWDELSDLAVFSAGVDAAGNLSDTARWDIADEAVAMGAPYGVRVHLCVTQFDPDTLAALLSSSTARNRLIDALADWEADTGAHGVNIDFEGLPVSVKSQMVQFVADLDAAVGDVVLATPAVDWAGSWDYDELTRHADLFIMGYDYHYGGSSYAGPSDPLTAGAGTVWAGANSYSLTWTVDDYLTWGADPSRVILGLPLYGRSWPTADNTVPAETLGSGSTVIYADAWDLAASVGSDFEPDSDSHYLRTGGDQVWFGDVETIRDRAAFARDDAGFAGIGFWAMHYEGDDPTFWAGLREETTTDAPPPDDPTDETTEPEDTGSTPGTTEDPDPEPEPSGDWIANAGAPFLVYVGDTVVLSGAASKGPEGAALLYEWTQVEGPPVTLTDASAVDPSFVVEEPGTVAFELRVGDRDAWSAPATSWVVVIDPGLPRRHVGCGCDAAGSGAVGLWALGLGLFAIRRRR